MLKWLLVLGVMVLVGGIWLPKLFGWLRIGRLPGDVTVRLGGRDIFLPFASTLLLSLLGTLLLRVL
ncbi:MAG: DUF2905 family protein [Rhodocyclaceae bacterium]